MGYDLYTEAEGVDGKDGYFRWNIWGWPPILNLGTMYGWEPAGTTIQPLTPELIQEHSISEEEARRHNIHAVEWEGSYHGNDGAIVSAEDASKLADALEASLDDIPDFEIKTPGAQEDGTVRLDNKAHEKHRQSLRDGAMAAYAVEYSGKENKEYIRKFIKFLRLGAFSIC